jgi:hypothetical protein
MKYTFAGDVIHVDGKWPTTKGKALTESIKKWKALVVYLEENPSAELPMATVDSCALCQLYYDFSTNETWVQSKCTGCPVAEKTGQGECLDTPFVSYDISIEHGKGLRAARREVKFLEGLKT